MIPMADTRGVKQLGDICIERSYFLKNILKCMAWFASSCLPLIHAVKSKFANARTCYDSSLSVVRCQITSAVPMAAVHMA